MAEKLLSTEQVLERIPFERTWLHDRIKAKEFPEPIHKWRKNLWRESVVNAWIDQHFPVDPANQPKPATERASR